MFRDVKCFYRCRVTTNIIEILYIVGNKFWSFDLIILEVWRKMGFYIVFNVEIYSYWFIKMGNVSLLGLNYVEWKFFLEIVWLGLSVVIEEVIEECVRNLDYFVVILGLVGGIR